MATIDPITGLPSSNTQNATTGVVTSNSTSIPVANITTPTTVVVPPTTPTVDPSTYTTPISNTAQYVSDAAKAQADYESKLASANTQVNDYSNLINQLGGKGADTANAYETGGVNKAASQINSLNAQITGLNNEAQAIPIQIQQGAEGQGVTDRGVAPIQAARLRENALKALSIGQQAAVAKADYDTAKSLADQQITLKYAPLEAKIAADKVKLDYLGTLTLTPAQEKAKEAKAQAVRAQEQDIADNKANEKDLQALSLTVAKNLASNGTPTDQINKTMAKITGSKSFNDAVIAASPYLQSMADKVDLNYKLAQTAKIYSDIKNDAATNGANVDPSQSLAYAQEYASTGKIPTGLPKGSFGKVAQWAKEMPKQDGEIVSSATGVHPGQDSTYADALSSLNSARKLAVELKDLDKKRIGGVVAGTLGKVFGSEDQQRYLDLRSQIVDLLSRARSGAALTPHEEELYSDMLPGRFSEAFGTGVNSEVKIDNFISALGKDAENKAKGKGWSIYGLSKVNLGDKEYKVGDILTAPDGSTGRVNPDGSITLIQ